MKTEELREFILKEAMYIKNLIEEKKDIEKKLKKIKDESLTTSNSLSAKKSMPKRLKDDHKLDEKEIEETTGKGLAVNHRASHKGKSGENLKVEKTKKDKINESLINLRKEIRKELYKSYEIND